MKLTRAVLYALQALVDMAGREQGRPVASHVVAEAQGVPERFLLKVLKPLVGAGILRSIKGPNGGYQLSKVPKDITLLDIVEAIDGPVRGHIPFTHERGKKGALESRLEHLYSDIAEQNRKQMQKVRLSELVGKG